MARRLPVLPLAWLVSVAGWTSGPVWSDSPPGAVGAAEAARLGQVAGLPGPGGLMGFQQETPINAVPNSPSESLLAAAVRMLESRESISAQIRHEVHLFDKHLVGLGVYLEQRSGRDQLFRVEMRIQLGDKSSSLVQVCDGRYLWTYQNMPSEGKLSRVDLLRVLRTIQRSEKIENQGDVNILSGIGGLPKLLRGLDAAFDFNTVEQGRWGQRKLPVWRLQGQWKRQQLAKLLPQQRGAIEKGAPTDLSKLAEHLPDHVVLLLGQEDLFPYRIEYRRMLPERPGQVNEPTSRALVTMDLFEVTINAAIDPMRFVYNPGESEVADQTDAFLASLGVKP